MEHIANKNAREYVENKTPFKGSNMWGERKSVLNTELFVVYSWGTHFPMYIAEWEKGADPDTALWYQNVDKYSQSTSRHQSQARPFSHNYQFSQLTTEAMRAVALHGITGLVVYGRAA